jgi:hypothetical protein
MDVMDLRAKSRGTGGSSTIPASVQEVVETSLSAVEDCSYSLASALLPMFLEEARSLGWRLQQTMLNPQETRLVQLQVQALHI